MRSRSNNCDVKDVTTAVTEAVVGARFGSGLGQVTFPLDFSPVLEVVSG